MKGGSDGHYLLLLLEQRTFRIVGPVTNSLTLVARVGFILLNRSVAANFLWSSQQPSNVETTLLVQQVGEKKRLNIHVVRPTRARGRYLSFLSTKHLIFRKYEFMEPTSVPLTSLFFADSNLFFWSSIRSTSEPPPNVVWATENPYSQESLANLYSSLALINISRMLRSRAVLIAWIWTGIWSHLLSILKPSILWTKSVWEKWLSCCGQDWIARRIGSREWNERS